MSYPVVTARGADQIADGLGTEFEARQWRDYIVMSDGPQFNHEEMTKTAKAHLMDWTAEKAKRNGRGEKADNYLLEAFMASRIHETLRDLPIDLLQDFGFWRYLALFPYRWYLKLREGGPSALEVKPQDYGGVGAAPVYQLLLRTFLWGKAAYDDSEPNVYHRATLVNDTGGAPTDVWHSHIVRVQLGHLGRLPHAFIDSICDDPRANSADEFSGARPVEKRLTRMKHTVLFDVYDLDEARAVVDNQKLVILGKL